MKIDKYKKFLEAVSISQVSFGSTTIHLFSEDELSKGQIGYSIDSNGKPLTGNDEGDWKRGWFVIGFEDLCGDPIFIDLEMDCFPVFTAMHGIGHWNEQEVAETFEGFVGVLEVIAGVSKGRNTDALLEQNPLSSKEKRAILAEIKKIIPNSSTGFWENLLDIELWEANLPVNHKPKLPK